MTPRSDGLSRRGFLGAGAAAALAGAAPAEAKPRKKHAKSRRRTRRADVAVVGGGFAGLAAAWEIVKAGRSVIVLEAQNHVGGRCRNHAIGGGEISERGATFAGPTQNHILGLAQEMGVGTFPTFAQGDNVYWVDGQRTTYSDAGPLGTAPPDPLIAADAATVITRLDQMASEVPVDAPWTAANAAEWDGQTFESWLNANSASPRFKRIAATATRPIFGAEPRELSLLFVLFYIAASGDEQHPGTFERNFNTRDGAQQLRFQGGSQRIALELARRLGRRVHLKRPVRSIEQADRRVTVHGDKVTVKARHAIVTAPPAMAARIRYLPALPIPRDQLSQRISQGTLLKVAAVYDRPFWREQGLNGTAVSLNGPANVVYDDSPEDGSPGVLFAFVGGDEARTFLAQSDADRRAAVLGNFTDYFGPQAQQAKATSRRCGRATGGSAAARWGSPRPGRCWPTGTRCASPSATCTGRARRARRSGRATWTARCAPGGARPRRCWRRSEATRAAARTPAGG